MPDQYSSEDRTYTKDYENLINALNQIGVIQGLEVTAKSPASLYVNVSTGRALFDKVYMEAGGTDLAITAADATNDRKDLVYLTPAGTLAVATGTAASIPKPPNIGGPERMILAQIYVTAGTPAIASSYIRDERFIISDESRKNVYEGGVRDSGTPDLYDDEDDVDSSNWKKVFSMEHKWGGW